MAKTNNIEKTYNKLGDDNMENKNFEIIKIMNTNMQKTINILDKMTYNMENMMNLITLQGKMIRNLKERVNELEDNNEDLDERIDDLEEIVENFKEPTIEELCEDVIQSDNDDDFINKYMELTSVLKAEVQQDIENEEKMKNGY